jgi:heme A synthase
MELNRFAKYAWVALAYTLVVIVWGAYVRASSAGAGCGSHWPLCNGEVIPRSPTLKTLIEFSHRLSSGLALILVVVMLIWAFRVYGRRHLARIGAALSMFFMLTEAAIGAGLVLFEYVAENKSIARALWMSGHLINTFLLVAAMSLVAWAATTGERFQLRGQGAINWLFATAIFGTLILGVSGAVTALGGTLFPVTSLAEGLRQDLSPTAHVLIRLRFFHPFIAVVVGAFLILTAWLVRARRPNEWIKRLANALIALVIVQLGAGVINLLLHAPIWLQLVHLMLSDFIWIALALLAFTVWAQPARETSIEVAQPVAAS